MSDANFASLSSSLLARKGGAKPAMRPQSGIQGPVDGAAAAANLEDLGWNDMGEDAPAPVAVAPAAAAPRLAAVEQQFEAANAADEDEEDDVVVALAPQAAAARVAPNQVRDSIDRIAAQIERPAPAAIAAAPVAAIVPRAAPAARPARRPNAASAAMSRRAAFTLRLDHERHLQLRLACTVRGRSAQQLVTDALDALLAEMPEIASLAAQVKRDSH